MSYIIYISSWTPTAARPWHEAPFLAIFMLRYMIFPWFWCYATWSFPGFHATLHDLSLVFMLRYWILPWFWCYATWSSLVSSGWGGVGWGWYYTCLLLRYWIFLWTSCYATWSFPGFDAMLHDLSLVFMLRYWIFLWTSCYATWSFPGFDATLLDLTLILMLRYLIFSCFFWVGWGGVGWGWYYTCLLLRYWIFLLTSCYATWSFPGFDATLHDLSLVFMLRYWIFLWTSCYATWSFPGFECFWTDAPCRRKMWLPQSLWNMLMLLCCHLADHCLALNSWWSCRRYSQLVDAIDGHKKIAAENHNNGGRMVSKRSSFEKRQNPIFASAYDKIAVSL